MRASISVNPLKGSANRQRLADCRFHFTVDSVVQQSEFPEHPVASDTEKSRAGMLIYKKS